MGTAYPLSWTTWSPPSIMLEGSRLVCYQHGVVTDTSFQVALLDLLSDLAGLAEEMGSGVAVPVA